MLLELVCQVDYNGRYGFFGSVSISTSRTFFSVTGKSVKMQHGQRKIKSHNSNNHVHFIISTTDFLNVISHEINLGE